MTLGRMVTIEELDAGVGAMRFEPVAPAHQALQGPVIDEDGLLRFRGRWVAITDSQLPLARLLVDRFEETVMDCDLAAAYASGGRVLTGALVRLRHRVSSCELVLYRVRRRGYLLGRSEFAPTECRQKTGAEPSESAGSALSDLTLS